MKKEDFKLFFNNLHSAKKQYFGDDLQKEKWRLKNIMTVLRGLIADLQTYW